MDLRRQEWIAKISLVNSIAQSQHALSRILNVVADVAEHEQSDKLARRLYENIQVLTQYQTAMYEMVAGMQFSRQKKGTPKKPWSGAKSIQAVNVARGVQEDKKNEKSQGQKKGSKANQASQASQSNKADQARQARGKER